MLLIGGQLYVKLHTGLYEKDKQEKKVIGD